MSLEKEIAIVKTALKNSGQGASENKILELEKQNAPETATPSPVTMQESSVNAAIPIFATAPKITPTTAEKVKLEPFIRGKRANSLLTFSPLGPKEADAYFGKPVNEFFARVDAAQVLPSQTMGGIPIAPAEVVFANSPSKSTVPLDSFNVSLARASYEKLQLLSVVASEDLRERVVASETSSSEEDLGAPILSASPTLPRAETLRPLISAPAGPSICRNIFECLFGRILFNRDNLDRLSLARKSSSGPSDRTSSSGRRSYEKQRAPASQEMDYYETCQRSLDGRIVCKKNTVDIRR
jgi:hypothetical protein